MAKLKVPEPSPGDEVYAPVAAAKPAKASKPAKGDAGAKEAEKGLVLYTDGGCKPSRGKGGWGLHGYLFSSDEPKKGSGNQDHILTREGYVTKIVANAFIADGGPLSQVTPIHYIDGWGSFGPDDVTNNIAELTAAIRALRYAADYEVVFVQVLTDSEYVQKHLSEGHADKWRRTGWIKSDQQPVVNAEYWEDLLTARDLLVDRGIKVRFDWVRGHNDNLGNTKADNFASYAVMLSKRGLIECRIDSTPADGYWKYETNRHPMIANRRCYFNTMAEYNDPGFYYLGDHGKEDDLLGKRVSDGAYSVVRLAEPDPVIELVRNHQIKLASNRDAIVMLRLDQMFKPSCHWELMNWGTNGLNQPKPYRLDLFGMDEKEPVSREFQPPRLAVRAVESLSDLADRLDMYLSGDPLITVTDITSILYETSLKTKKVKGGGEEVEVIQSLKSEYSVGFASMQVDVLYGGANDPRTAKATLTLGIDLLDRNALNRLAGLKPQVKVITWLESPTAFRYATVVEAGEDKGIWAGVYSNLRIVG